MTVVTILLTLTVAGPAFAQPPAVQGYGGQGGNVLGGVQGSGGAAGVETGGTLPFTGIDLTLLVIGGIVLTAVGAGLVRATARR